MALDFYTVQQAISGSAAAGGRAGLTLLGMSIAGYCGWIDFPPGIALLATLPGIAGLAGITLIEEFTERDEDMQEILQWVSYGTKGMAGALAIWSIDVMPEGTPPWLATPVGMILAGATHYYRMKLHETLRGLGDHWLSPRTYLVWLETGGIVALIAAILIAPILAMLMVVGFFIVGGVYMGLRYTAEQSLYRQPCPQCEKRIRKEASVCRFCATDVTVAKWLAKPQSGNSAENPTTPSETISKIIDVPAI